MKILTTNRSHGSYLRYPSSSLALMHFAFAENMAKAIPSFLPGGVFWVYATGAGLIAAATISLFIQKMVKEAMFGLVALPDISNRAMIHMPGMGNPDPMMQQMAMSGLFKDIGLLGGALTYAGIYSQK
jgi:putative oxidoreductase